MKKTLQKILLEIILAVAPISCKALINPNEVIFNIPSIEYPETKMDNRTILNGYERGIYWTARNITFLEDKENSGFRDYWANPEETYYKKKGDCEDFVILDMYLLKRDFDTESFMVTGINRLTGLGHGWLKVNERTYESELGVERDFRNYTILNEYSYNEIMNIVLNHPIQRRGLIE